MSEYISKTLRDAVWERASGCCEYCRIHNEDSFYSHEVDHIIPKKHGGKSAIDNLALACYFCNRYKGADIGSVDPITRNFARFFNPRTQKWEEHFKIAGGRIIPLTPTGKVTAIILKLNNPKRIVERELLIKLGYYPRSKF